MFKEAILIKPHHTRLHVIKVELGEVASLPTPTLKLTLSFIPRYRTEVETGALDYKYCKRIDSSFLSSARVINA